MPLLLLDPTVQVEGESTRDRIILWLPGVQSGGYRHWRRVGTVAQAQIVRYGELGAAPATAVDVRQHLGGWFSKLAGGWRRSKAQTWSLPDGTHGEQVGGRQAELLLVWSEVPGGTLEESAVRASFSRGKDFARLGGNLFLVGGIPAAKAPVPPPAAGANPLQIAQDLLAAARQSGDPAREIAALTDLGVLHTRSGAAAQAVPLLEEALQLARQSGDRRLEGDVAGNLALAILAVRQPARARELLQETLDWARTAKDRFVEKSTLESLGEVHAALGDHTQALDDCAQATAIAHELGDTLHQAELLWQQAVALAELGRREAAVAQAEAALQLFGKLGHPQTTWLTGQLQAYRTTAAATLPTREQPPQGAGQVAAGAMSPVAAGGSGDKQGPGLLRMALDGAKSLGKFIGSGLKTVPGPVHQKRLATCAVCEHHTGLRCKLCGCFTIAKAWLPHERCPVGRWST
jgi:tetratricopeptide (TPR) repeat protein